MYHAVVQGFKLGTYNSEALKIGVANLSHLDVLGVLGMDFIDQFVWVIDTTNSCLAFEHQANLEENDEDVKNTLNLILKNNRRYKHWIYK